MERETASTREAQQRCSDIKEEMETSEMRHKNDLQMLRDEMMTKLARETKDLEGTYQRKFDDMKAKGDRDHTVIGE